MNNHQKRNNAGNAPLWVVFGVLAIGAIVWAVSLGARRESGAAPLPQSALTASESFFDFGTISMAKGNVTHMFPITNAGANDVTIEKLYTSCMCTSAALIYGGERIGPFGMPGHAAIPRINTTIAAGGAGNIEVIFNPAAHGPAGIGPVNRTVYVETADGGVAEFRFSANVTP